MYLIYFQYCIDMETDTLDLSKMYLDKEVIIISRHFSHSLLCQPTHNIALSRPMLTFFFVQTCVLLNVVLTNNNWGGGYPRIQYPVFIEFIVFTNIWLTAVISEVNEVTIYDAR